MSANARPTISGTTTDFVVNGLFLSLYERNTIVTVMVVISSAFDPVAANCVG